MRRRNGVGPHITMNLFEETKNRPNESTNSSDSGVIVEESTTTTENDASTKIECDIKIETGESNIKSTNKDNDSCKRNYKIEDENEDRGTISSEHSDRSHNISIVSLEDVDSSVIDSDSDFSDEPGEFVIQKLGQHSGAAAAAIENDGIVIVNSNTGREPSCSTEGVSANKPHIGSIAVQNSTDITFGNKTFYQGPVTIKQFLLENKKWKPKEEGADNEGFENDELKKASNETPPETEPQSVWNNLKKKLRLNSKPVIIAVIIIILTIISCATALIMWATLNGTSEDNNSDGSGVLRLISRDEWSARPPKENLTDLELPVKLVIIAHTVTDTCNTMASCIFRVNFIQSLHMDSEAISLDIGYNFLVGGDGAAYEGRGWHKMGAHTPGFNRKSICIAFIGSFMRLKPQEKQLKAAQLLIKEGVRQGKLAPDYILYGARQLIATESPGETLFAILQTWPHWSDEVD